MKGYAQHAYYLEPLIYLKRIQISQKDLANFFPILNMVCDLMCLIFLLLPSLFLKMSEIKPLISGSSDISNVKPYSCSALNDSGGYRPLWNKTELMANPEIKRNHFKVIFHITV